MKSKLHQETEQKHNQEVKEIYIWQALVHIKSQPKDKYKLGRKTLGTKCGSFSMHFMTTVDYDGWKSGFLLSYITW